MKLLTRFALSFLSRGLLAVGIASEVSKRQPETGGKSLRLHAVPLRVVVRRAGDSGAVMRAADAALCCAGLLSAPGGGPPPGITSGEDTFDGEGRKT